ncbi:MAG: hypothetical protein JW795_17420 [Chitinivibrionales bacterium]|nr:hypothetical protein [Chitinivibrionales bacterium]
MKKTIVAFLLLLSCFLVFAQTKIVILPFINTGLSYSNFNEETIASNLYVQLNQLPKYKMLPTSDVLTYGRQKSYTTKDFYKLSVLNEIVQRFKVDFIIGGEYKIESKNLVVFLNVFGQSEKMMTQSYYSVPIRSTRSDALNDIIPKLVEPFKSYNPDLAEIIINTKEECVCYIDNVRMGTTPRRFKVGAGEHAINIVYESEMIQGSIFQKKIKVKNRDILDLGELPVLVEVRIESNVKSDVLINKKKVGATDTIYALPIDNTFYVTVEYRDENGDRRFIDDIISTKDRKSFVKSFDFTGRIKIEGPEPLFGRLSGKTELQKLPYCFSELPSGRYIAQTVLHDHEWNNDFIINEKEVIIRNAETEIIKNDSFYYEPNYALCLIPSAAQFHNYEPVKGGIIAGLSALILSEIVVTAIWASSIYNDMNSATESNEYETLRSSYQTTSVFMIGGLISAGILYLYSGIDGLINTNRLEYLNHSKM